MNMREPTTAWDRNPTDAELDRFYGKEKPTEVRDEYFEVLTKTIRTVPASNLSLEYYSNLKRGLAQYPVSEIVTDYGTDTEPLDALLAVLEESDCPFVAKYREALAKKFADQNADEVEEFRRAE
jgi:hypothetical protein